MDCSHSLPRLHWWIVLTLLPPLHRWIVLTLSNIFTCRLFFQYNNNNNNNNDNNDNNNKQQISSYGLYVLFEVDHYYETNPIAIKLNENECIHQSFVSIEWQTISVLYIFFTFAPAVYTI